jgi:peptidoglycan/LPS O-acetylase OafA/YrhL
VLAVFIAIGVLHDQWHFWLGAVFFYENFLWKGLASLSACYFVGHFWSLAVEEHFYLFWPLVVWLCPRRTLVGVSLAIAVASLAARVALSTRLAPIDLYVLTPFRFDALCLGGALAAIGRGAGGLALLGRIVRPMAAAAAAVFVVSYAFNLTTGLFFVPFHEIRNSMLVVLLASVLLVSLEAPAAAISSRFFNAASMRYLGMYSYGLYVFHHFFAYVFVHRGTEFELARVLGSHTAAVLLQAAFGVAASLAVSVASYHLYEKRFIALKRFWSDKRAGRGGASATA